MPAAKAISQDRALRLARALACSHCQEYSFKKIAVKPAPKSHERDLKTLWVAFRTCGVCGLESEIGFDAEGDLAYGG